VNVPGTFSSTASVPNEGYSGVGHNGFPIQAGAASLSNSGGFSLPNGGTITEMCHDDNAEASGFGGGNGSDVPLNYSGYYLTAIRVASLRGAGSTALRRGT
jgi:hypothetical protein